MAFRIRVDISFRKVLAGVRGRLRGEGLCWPTFFTRNIRSRDRPLLNGKQRCTGNSVKNKNIALFCYLCYRIYLFTIMSDSNQVRWCRRIAVQYIMVYQLEVPETLPRFCIKGEQTIRKKI